MRDSKTKLLLIIVTLAFGLLFIEYLSTSDRPHRPTSAQTTDEELGDNAIENENWVANYSYISAQRPDGYKVPTEAEYMPLIYDTEWKNDPRLNPFLLPKPYIFSHIPKTGGTSLVELFRKNEDPDKFMQVVSHPHASSLDNVTKCDTIFGHMQYGLHYYYELKRPDRIPDRDDGMNKYSYMTMLREPVERVISHYYFLRDSKTHPLHSFSMVYNLTQWLDKTPIGDNEQTRRLIGFQKMEILKTNVGKQRQRIDITDEVREQIRRKNWMDVIVYEKAKEIFEKEIDAIGRDFIEKETEVFLAYNTVVVDLATHTARNASIFVHRRLMGKFDFFDWFRFIPDAPLQNAAGRRALEPCLDKSARAMDEVLYRNSPLVKLYRTVDHQVVQRPTPKI
eukprot:gene7491-8764_t